MAGRHALTGHLFLLGLCSWAIYVQTTYRIPGGHLLFLLPAVNIAATCLTLILLILRLMGSVSIEEPLHTLFRWVQLTNSAFIVAFGLYNGLVFINARWDMSTLNTVPSKITDIGGNEIDFGYPMHYFWADLQSWRSPKNTERLMLRLSERENLWVGRPVLLQLHAGYFHIPWVSAIEPNREREWLDIINDIPTASRPRQNLTYLYLEQHRWEEVKRLSEQQMKFYPNNLVFIRYVTAVLLNAYRYSEIVALLEPIAKTKSDYQVYGKLGFALAMTGRKAEGMKYLESAILKEPRNYWAYSALGYAHVYTGTPKNAVPYFKRVLEIRPGFPEVQDMLRKIGAAESPPSAR